MRKSEIPGWLWFGLIVAILGAGVASIVHAQLPKPAPVSGAGGSSAAVPVFDAFTNRPTCNTANTGVWFFPTSTTGFYNQYCDGSAWHSFYRGISVTPPPAVASWTVYNSASASNVGGAVVIAVTPGNGNTSLQGLYIAYSGSHTATARMRCGVTLTATSGSGCGMFVTDATKATSFYVGGSTATVVNVADWTDATHFSTNAVDGTRAGSFIHGGGDDFWMRIQDNGTNLLWSLSMDGVNFQQVFSRSRTSFLTPTAWGVYGANFDSTGAANLPVTLLDWVVQ